MEKSNEKKRLFKWTTKDWVYVAIINFIIVLGLFVNWYADLETSFNMIASGVSIALGGLAIIYAFVESTKVNNKENLVQNALYDIKDNVNTMNDLVNRIDNNSFETKKLMEVVYENFVSIGEVQKFTNSKNDDVDKDVQEDEIIDSRSEKNDFVKVDEIADSMTLVDSWLFMGDFCLIDFGEGVRNEARGVRPALVIQNEFASKKLGSLTVVPLTSKVEKLTLPTQVRVEQGNFELKVDSIIMTEQITTIGKERVLKKYGRANDKLLKDVQIALLIHLGMK